MKEDQTENSQARCKPICLHCVLSEARPGPHNTAARAGTAHTAVHSLSPLCFHFLISQSQKAGCDISTAHSALRLSPPAPIHSRNPLPALLPFHSALIPRLSILTDAVLVLILPTALFFSSFIQHSYL